MKTLLTVCLMVVAAFATSVLAGENPAAVPLSAAVVTGKVLEVKDVGSYTYLLLKTKEGETWAAVNKTALRPGTQVTIENVMFMKNFESKALKKTFPAIVFGTLGGTGNDMASAHAGVAQVADTSPIKVPKASGANARTVAEIVTMATELKDKPVQVRGKIVKYNPAIMGKNWLHLRDGSGTAADNTQDVLVTTSGQARLGDVVTVTGVVRTDKDFGSGYAYKVLIEDATLRP
jgi:hypothetical protein